MIDTSLLGLLEKGGITVIVLIFCSILSIGVVFEKFIAFKGIKEDFINKIKDRVTSSLKNGNFNEALFFCEKSTYSWFLFKISSPVAAVYKFMIDNRNNYNEEKLYEKAIQKLDKELIKLEKRLGILATLGAVAPFIGLFGTVLGIIKSFSALSINDISNYSQVMAGISEALIATAVGLVVAVPAVIFYNYFSKQIKIHLPIMEEAIQDVLMELKR